MNNVAYDTLQPVEAGDAVGRVLGGGCDTDGIEVEVEVIGMTKKMPKPLDFTNLPAPHRQGGTPGEFPSGRGSSRAAAIQVPRRYPTTHDSGRA